MKFIISVALATAILIAGCSPATRHGQAPQLVTIHTIDRNGFSETLHSKDRLRPLQNADFLSPQPYKKVMRTFKCDASGSTPSIITGYYQNGQVKQYLEVAGSQAYGTYREWHIDGSARLEARITGGDADIGQAAENSWIFDGISLVWDNLGGIAAEIPYRHGELQGTMKTYNTNKKIKELIPYKNNTIHGTAEVFNTDGTMLSQTEFSDGEKHGTSEIFRKNGSIISAENYDLGSLRTGDYYDATGGSISKIRNGEGFRAIFAGDHLAELRHYSNGKPEGIVKILKEDNTLVQTYHIKDDVRHGEEVEYFPNGVAPKLSVMWFEGHIQGLVKTWYVNGSLESSKEMSMSKKTGISSAWYRNGNLMLMEEYNNDKLDKGKYYKKGVSTPISKVIGGEGLATLFDPEGAMLKKIPYHSGIPMTS